MKKIRIASVLRMCGVVSIVLLFCVSGFVEIANSATLYMGPNEAYRNLSDAVSAMSAGDTLIIRDGTYTGTSNVFSDVIFPPVGSEENWTTIKAEHDGGVVFDGGSTNTVFNIQSDGNKYWQFEGLVFLNGEQLVLRYSDYVKFIDCGLGGKFSAGAQGFFY